MIFAGAASGPDATVAMSEPDLTAVRAAGVARVVIGVVVAACGLVGAGNWDRSVGWLLLLIGLAWLPWSVLLFAVGVGGTDRLRRPWLAAYGGPVGDIVIVFAAQCLVPWAWGIFLLADALAVNLAASLWRTRDAWFLYGFCVALTMLAQGLVPADQRLAGGLLVIFALALAGLVVVVGRIARGHRQVAVSSHRFQQKAETILARVADGIVVTDGAGIVREWNPAGERLIGAQATSALGLPCARALGLREGERPLECAGGCALLGAGARGDAGEREVWRTLPDGRRQPLLASAFAVTDERGEVEVVHSLRDITRLKEADEAKTLFLATASHELKTPVTVIAGFAEAILRFPSMPDDRRAEAVEAIHRRALELSSIVDRLLLSSKIESGRVAVDIHPVDVRPMLNERANAIQDASGRHMILQVAAETLVAHADPLALRTVVDHLLDNAVKYSDGGPVVVGAERRPGVVVLWVSDIGIGMDAEQAERCFDKFWQAESTDVRRFGGTGIGLYIVSSMVEAMGGTITVETAVGRGSTFTVSLPAVGNAPSPDHCGPVDADVLHKLGVLSRGGA
ncbi:MAG TPA: PAS domain-containing sensor histidine kinase [Acidimicrobiales bacterium]|nr:PAS domain-containing sensor histidine kinase [Acidimicrobiales bacterium]